MFVLLDILDEFQEYEILQEFIVFAFYYHIVVTLLSCIFSKHIKNLILSILFTGHAAYCFIYNNNLNRLFMPNSDASIILHIKITVGYYIYDTILKLYDKSFEYIFHHITSIILINILYSINLQTLIIYGLLITDITNIPRHLSHYFYENGYPKLLKLSFSIFTISFFMCRIIGFGFIFYQSFFYDLQLSKWLHIFSQIIFTGLYGLQFYWFKRILELKSKK